MYRLRLLGGLALEGPSGLLSGRVVQQKRLALLALLAASRDSGLSRDKLAGYLWPESDDERARHRLSDTLHVIRRALGDEAVLASGEVLRLNPDVVWTDVRELEEALERGEPGAAADAYSGPFLDGVHLGEALEFERWVDGERERYAGLYARALETLALQAEDAGDYGQAVGWWKRLAAQDPYDSRLVVRVMEALAAAGDVANALQHARAHQLLLREELEVEPAPEVLAAAERLREESAGRLVAQRALHPPEGLLPSEPRPRGRQQEIKNPLTLVAAFLGRRVLRPAYVVATAVGFVVAGWMVSTNLRGGEDAATRAPLVSRRVIAVLPVRDLSEGQDFSVLAAGFTDVLIGKLEQDANVDVVPRVVLQPYLRRDLPLDSISDQFAVRVFLASSLVGTKERLRLRIDLIDGVTFKHLSNTTLELKWEDSLELMDSLSTRVSRLLGGVVDSLKTGTLSTPGRSTERVDNAGLLGRCYDLYQTGNVRSTLRCIESAGPRRHVDPAYVAMQLMVLAGPHGVEPDVVEAWRLYSLLQELSSLSGADFDRLAPTALLQVSAVLARAGLHDSARAVLREVYERPFLSGVEAQAEDGWYGIGFHQPDCRPEITGQAEDDWVCSVLPVINRVWETGPAYAAGMRVGDVVVGVNGLDILTEEGWRVFYHARLSVPVTFRILRDGEELTLTVTPTSPETAFGEDDEWLRIYDSSRTYDLSGALYNGANAWLQLGDVKKALDLLSRYLDLNPDRAGNVRQDWWWADLQDDPRFQELTEGKRPDL